ncbi:MAG: hypothetical protein DSM106950_21190 [Stigonema ocellatum SAG 48.90 = DSM 106950]|nr:hypothetical protein [Stigonema ocellatum SAG 48.90 = DSM 106950]
MIDASMLRSLWAVIEENQATMLLGLNDTDLIQQITQQLENKKLLSSEESNTVSAYLQSRTNLIRELALSRIV